MNATKIKNLLNRDKVKRKIQIAGIIYTAITTIGLILMFPYDRTLFLYLVPLSYIGPYIIILTLYLPFFLIFKAFGKDCQYYEDLTTAVKARLSSDKNEVDHIHGFSIF